MVEQKAGAAGKKDDGIITAVFEIDLHCEGCTEKIVGFVKDFYGVDDVKADLDANELRVRGKMNPTALKERLEKKFKKKVYLLLPYQPGKKYVMITAVFKIDLHCEGCAKKIKRAVKDFDGVDDVKADSDADKLTVTGRVNTTALKERLEKETKKTVDLLSTQLPKKGAGGESKHVHFAD